MDRLGRMSLVALVLVGLAHRAGANEGRQMKAAGIALVVIGSALTIAGAALVTHVIGREIDNGGPSTPLKNFEFAGGMTFLAVGQASIASGIPLWIVGGKRGVVRARVLPTAGGIQVRF